MKYPQSAVLENPDLLRVIGEFIPAQLPFMLSSKAARTALKPFYIKDGEEWIMSIKKHFATSVSMVEWAQSLGCEFSLTRYSNNLFTYAARSGSLDVLKWAHENHPPDQHPEGLRFDVCCEAARNGHLEVLEYLRSFGTIVKWNEVVSNYAAYGSKLHILQWLREVLDPPCPWDEHTCKYAARNNNLQILQWLRSQDPPCPWSERTCVEAALNGHLEILKWVRSQDPPCPWEKQECIDKARYRNQYKVVEWILSQPE